MANASVLIVDDEEDIRNALGRCLRREGYQLHFAAGGVDALGKLEKVPIDLVVTDHRMPDMTGLDLIKRIRETKPDVMRVILTGYADFDTIKSAINEAEIYRFLTKPWDDEDLRLTVRSALERRELVQRVMKLEDAVRRHEQMLAELERSHPGITQIERDADGAIVIHDES